LHTLALHTLEPLGWTPFFQDQLDAALEPDLVPARVVIEYQDRYRLLGTEGYSWAQLSGNIRHQAEVDRLGRPAVGDWVAVRPAGDDDMGTIVHLLERQSCFVRQSAGRRSGAQVVAANIDTVFVVTSCNRDFNPRRIERYLTTVWNSGAGAVIVLNKADLCDPEPYLAKLATAAPDVAVAVVSALEEQGKSQLLEHIRPGLSVALVGSSGVGKSTLVNWLVGREVQEVRAIREDDARGRHTTTHRELILMPGGGVLIDTPGMRELQLWSAGEGLAEAFADIESLAQTCRFRDCAHGGEPGCAIAQSLRAGTLDPGRVASYLKLRHEQEAQETRQALGTRQLERGRGKRGSKLMRQQKLLKE
jgi:ribosome biogenesis GTPase / thiamine phosphate phosphatase